MILRFPCCVGDWSVVRFSQVFFECLNAQGDFIETFFCCCFRNLMGTFFEGFPVSLGVGGLSVSPLDSVSCYF